MSLINKIHIDSLKRDYQASVKRDPFPYIVLDNFFEETVFHNIQNEFPDYEESIWHVYDNYVEHKKTCNIWNNFSTNLFRLFSYLNSEDFVSILRAVSGLNLSADCGLHGGGLHIHGPGGLLNPHLDYDIHPKLGLQRRLNLIIYVHESFRDCFGGKLGFWSHNKINNSPGKLFAEIDPIPNRAVLFDTSLNSWHGITAPIAKDSCFLRKSLAAYYLTPPTPGISTRERALYAPVGSQGQDPTVLEFIKKRADRLEYSKAYITGNKDKD